MDYTCVQCGKEYGYKESPSDDFCSQVCSENWTYHKTAQGTRYDTELDEDARRIRGGDEDPENTTAAVAFMSYLLAAARRRELYDRQRTHLDG